MGTSKQNIKVELWKQAMAGLLITLAKAFIGALILLLLIVALAKAGYGWTPITLDKYDMRLQKFTGNRDPMTPSIEYSEYTYRVTSDFNLSILRYGFWDNVLHTEAVEHGVRTVGWHWMLGIRVAPWLDILHEHHSRHVMDQDQEVLTSKFPVEDSYGIRLKIYESTRKPGSIWK